MRSYSLQAAAKINLYLEILGHRSDSYHELAMVMQSIDRRDRLQVRASGTEAVRVFCHNADVPTDDRNLAHRAAMEMARQFPEAYRNLGGVDITIDKQIPVAAGLAGGSADAAALLVGLNLLWDLGLTLPELQAIAPRIGSDVAFCIDGGTALATGRGEEISPLLAAPQLYAVLGKQRSLQVSTPWAYRTYREQFGSEYARDPETLAERRSRVHSGPMVAAIAAKDADKIASLLHNDLERVVLPAHPRVAQLRNTFLEAGALGAMMSGSGPSVFALVESETAAQRVMEETRSRLDDTDLELWVTQFVPTGVTVVGDS